MNKSALKLFMLRYIKSGAIVTGDDGKPLFFSHKGAAKAVRTKDMKVSFGPDHHKFNAHREVM